MAELSVVIVTHNSAGTIAPCLEAAVLCADDVIVVDNASVDSTLAVAGRFPSVTVLANPENRGFAGGANQGTRQTRHPLILLLNPDTVLQNHPAPLATACGQRGYGAAAGMLIGDDRRPQQGFSLRRLPTAWSLAFEVLGLNRIFPKNPVNRRWRALDLDLSRAQDVEQPAGAFLMYRRDVWLAAGGFDERFHPVWFEDVDFCRKLNLGGWRIRYVPEVRARHSGGTSIRQMDPVNRQVQWYVSLLRYSATAFGLFGRLGVAVSVALAAAFRWCWSTIHPALRAQAKAFPKVFVEAMRALGNALLGRGVKGVKGEADTPAWSRARTANTHSEATDTQPNVP